MNKKGMELSINVVVVLIIGIVLLGIGIFLVNKVVNVGEKYQQDIDEKLIEQLVKTTFSDGRVMGVLNPSAEVQRGDEAWFLLGFINNAEESKTYKVKLMYNDGSPMDGDLQSDFPTTRAFLMNNPNAYMLHEFFDTSKSIELEPNERHFMWIVYEPPKDMPQGKILYDVFVCEKDGSGGWDQGACPNTYKMYTNRKLRLFITVR